MKTFTVDEVNKLVPQLDVMLGEMKAARDHIVEMNATLKPLMERSSGNGGNKSGTEYALLLQHFQADLQALQDMGCELKDLDQGLVDFLSYRDGQLVYLCWKRGEKSVEFWHTLEGGFGKRQPL